MTNAGAFPRIEGAGPDDGEPMQAMRTQALAAAIALLAVPAAVAAQPERDPGAADAASTASLEAATLAANAEVEAQAVTDTAAAQEKKICRTERMTGSLTRVRRTCLTRAQWDRLAEGSRRNFEELLADANQKQAAEGERYSSNYSNPVPGVPGPGQGGPVF